MIPIFRKARKKLIEEARLQRYLIYAVGEIFLVVIGILIALQVRNQNEIRKRNVYEEKMMLNLKRDLVLEKQDLGSIIQRRESKAASARKMARYHRQEAVDTLKNYYSHFANVLYWEVHHPNDKTFQELLNAGNLSLIENKQVKRNLLEMENQYDQITELREHMKEDYTLFFYQEYKDIFNFSVAIRAWAQPNKKYAFSAADVQACLSNRAIENGYTLAAFNNMEMGRRSTKVLNIVAETIDLIEEDLKQE